MANEYSKEERVAFDQLAQGFEDALVASEMVSIFRPEMAMMERTGDILWRPQPYIARSFDGLDQTANFKDQTQLSVPTTLGFKKASPWLMTLPELRDALQENRLGDAAKQKLASDINVAVLNTVSNEGTIVVTKSTPAADFGDVAALDTALNRVGVQGYDRMLALSSGDYNALARDMANRATMTGKPTTAYERAFVGVVSGFDTFKLDYANTCPAAAGGAGLTINTTVAGAQFYAPKATSTGANGEVSNVDNRRQRVTISLTTGVVAGDRFTIAGVTEAHHITKASTGVLKQFTVISNDSATTLTISPPIISGQGATDAELQYKNCVVAGAGSATAAIVFLNIAAKAINPFWQKGAVELLPGRYNPPTNSGWAIMRATTKQGIEIVMTKQSDIDTMKTKFRLDVFFGVTMLQPEMAGIALFSQA